jgi:hypothetical protein
MVNGVSSAHHEKVGGIQVLAVVVGSLRTYDPRPLHSFAFNVIRCLPMHGALVILGMVALAVDADTTRSEGMPGSMIETLPWPE